VQLGSSSATPTTAARDSVTVLGMTAGLWSRDGASIVVAVHSSA